RIVLEMAVARLATTRPVQPVASLLGRLEDLERRLRQSGAGAPPAGARRGPRSAEPRRSHHAGHQAPAPRAPRSRAPSRATSPLDDDDDGSPGASRARAEVRQPVVAA